MPVYEFACEACGKEFSTVLTVKEREHGPITCPWCDSPKVTALITVFAVKTSKKS